MKKGVQTAGFTLFELLVSLTILSVILVLVTGALRIGIRAWESGGDQIADHQRLREVFRLMGHQIGSLDRGPIRPDGPPPLFKGDAAVLTFRSEYAVIQAESGGRVLVYYEIETLDEGGCRFRFFEGPAGFGRAASTGASTTGSNIGSSIGSNRPHDAEDLILIPWAEKMSFEYLRSWSLADGYQWEETWDHAKDGRLPLAVRISLRLDARQAPFYLIVPIRT
jgi:general secretion pathway protein J